ncbi:MAG TPA: universal stress protein [Ktedonobacteraceae bacterium]|nr:universal stress protein [Ktedonobacteraceae bacterium]
MFQHILILLDGSTRAELALPVAVRLARATGASLTLLRMVMLPPDYVWYQLEPPFLAHALLEEEMRKASTYLKGKAWEMDLTGIPVHTHIMPGLPLDRIHTFLEEHAIDLVVLCSRGQITCRPRIRRSMAQQVLRQSSVPVLVLQETCELSGTLSPQGAHPVRLLVALDGSALAEAVLQPAALLSAALSAPLCGALHLVRVLPVSDVMRMGEGTRRHWKRARDHALAYLETLSQKLQEGDIGQLHLSVTTSVLFHSHIAETLVNVAEARQQDTRATEARGESDRYDIIAMTTHGRSGLSHPRIGSTAERILQETLLPLLIVHPSFECSPEEKETAYRHASR